MRMVLSVGDTAPRYVAVLFKGAQYMCVSGSVRAAFLREANAAWRMGYDSLSRELFSKATIADGCAFATREGLRHA